MHGQNVELSGVSMTYPNGFTAVHPTDLTINAGEFFSILGPSGCGKTTILRMISGFLEPSTGSISIGAQSVNGLGPNKRPTALIFQTLALFPLMSVWENVAFGLEARGVSKQERRRKAEELLELVALTGQAEKKPTELSGGQRQRVAVARALAVEPAVLLLDEPLSALDLKLRQHMRAELKDIQRKTGVTFIYITHDQGEALAMSDRVAVMNEGRIEQIATAAELYNMPQTPFAATFVGEQNVFGGRVKHTNGTTVEVETGQGLLRGRNFNDLTVGEEALVLVRPERIEIADADGVAGNEDSNRISGQLLRRDLEGALINLYLRSGEQEIHVNLHNKGNRDFSADESMTLAFSTADTAVMRPGPMARSSA
ncbi:ABC transporter ATP-binding protein [Denitrobaculum tricleocarpae]|uniref:ABC transporter ATP-binding protein n=1 Tax=Denitrobaculum tricleocarpae TaxID=2591009 RepID=A0A545TER5_9PROT|nr:ABC transporter ATP-binding protein [Denitrobaculum tricleocarpae]TQV75702.1 ABC transporter ATP-binding protein [Denitrobaculum tricleocarpae]